MADVSKIKLGSTTYDVKDATARSNISNLQTAINNIESITQTEIDEITDYTPGSFPAPVYGYDTVADMQADTSLQEGMVCHTNGFHAAGDGGAAYYAVGTLGTVNGMDVLACANSLIATLVVDEIVTPEMFGAYGDGTSDDSEALRKAVTYPNVSMRSGATYLCSLVGIPENVTIDGNGAIVESGTNTAFVILRTSHDICIKNINFSASFTVGDTSTTSNACISIAADQTNEEYSAYNIEIDHCKFTFGVFGIGGSSVQNLYIHDCEFYGGVYRPEDSAGGYAILTQSCSNVTIERCYFKLGTYARHDIYVSVSQIKTANISNRNYTIRNCISDRSLITEYSGDSFYSPTILAIAVRSTYNLLVENYRVYNGTGLIFAGTADGPIVNAIVRNCVNDSPRFKSNSQMVDEMRQSYGCWLDDNSNITFENCQTLNVPSTSFNSYGVNGGIIEIGNAKINARIDVGDCKSLYLHDLYVTGHYLRFIGTGVLRGKFRSIDSDGNYIFGSATNYTNGAYIDINAYEDKLLGPWAINNTTGVLTFITGKIHIGAVGAAENNNNGTIITLNYSKRPTEITRAMSLTDGSFIEANTTTSTLEDNQVRIRKLNLSDGSAASSRSARFYLC